MEKNDSLREAETDSGASAKRNMQETDSGTAANCNTQETAMGSGMAANRNIFLIGFMGSGKSTISSYFKEHFGWDVVEMDDRIAQREGMSINEIFRVHGEAYFRDAETALLRELQSRTNTVISCGGGTPLREVNVTEMKKNGIVVLLAAAPETIFDRVKDSHDRPLLEGNKTVEFIAGMLKERQGKYEAAADVIIETDHKDAGEICAEIMGYLQ